MRVMARVRTHVIAFNGASSTLVVRVRLSTFTTTIYQWPNPRVPPAAVTAPPPPHLLPRRGYGARVFDFGLVETRSATATVSVSATAAANGLLLHAPFMYRALEACVLYAN